MLYFMHMTRRPSTQRVKRGSTEWINVEHARNVDVKAIAKELKLSDEHVQTILTASHRSRLFVADKYVLLLITHPVYDKLKDDVVTKELDVIITPRKIVTIHHSHFVNVSGIFGNVKERRSTAIMKHPVSVLGEILTTLTLDVYEMLELMAKRIDMIEDQVFANKKNLLQEIVNVQTNIIDVRKTLESRTAMIDRLLASISKAAARYMQSSHGELSIHTEEIQSSLAIEYQTIQALHRAHETYLNTRTNRLINILTAVTIVVMPATLMAGIFGMNTSHPWILGMQADFSVIIGIMAVSGLILYLLLKRLR